MRGDPRWNAYRLINEIELFIAERRADGSFFPAEIAKVFGIQKREAVLALIVSERNGVVVKRNDGRYAYIGGSR